MSKRYMRATELLRREALRAGRCDLHWRANRRSYVGIGAKGGRKKVKSHDEAIWQAGPGYSGTGPCGSHSRRPQRHAYLDQAGGRHHLESAIGRRCCWSVGGRAGRRGHTVRRLQEE